MNWLHSIFENPFYEIAIILALAAFLGVLGQILKQPLIVMFIALGILVGPAVLDIVSSRDQIHLLAEIGIALLLFIVGLRLDLRIIRSMGKVALLTGLGQVIFTSLFGYIIGLLLGFPDLHSFYIAVALTFSSTIIIVKLLSDKKEIDSLHGQIAIGFLIVQDIVVIVMMIILSTLHHGEGTNFVEELFQTLLAGLGLLLFAFISMKWVFPQLNNFIGRSQELLTLFSIAWAIWLASVGEFIGFSGEVGAFLAGVSLASSEFKEVISVRLISLRDFLLLFFFVNLGANLDLSVIGSQIYPAMIFSVFVLIGNPLIVLIIMGLIGYHRRTSFLAGLTVAQISEFSLIFAGLGFTLGHITNEVVGLITLVGLITIGLSTYMILYSHQLYEMLSPTLNLFQRGEIDAEKEYIYDRHIDYDLIIIGLGRFGRRLAEKLDEQSKINYLVVDFDPGVISECKVGRKDVMYGDMEDPDLLEHIPYSEKTVIVSTVANNKLSYQLVKLLQKKPVKGYFVTTSTSTDYRELRSFGISEEHILRPHQMAAQYFYHTFLEDKDTS